MNVLSLFSGVGGFDLGLERAGMKTVFQCEWDKHATKVLERHWPDVPRWGDVSTLTGAHVLQHAPVVDVVAWGSPCQDLSVAGKRAGLSGERSGLFHEGIRLIKELREASNGRYPTFSIWENVAGALSSNGGADFGSVIDEMAKVGAMVIEWAVLDAQYFGIPQRRRRVFVVAIFDPAVAERSPDPLLPLGESLRRNPKTRNKTRKTTTGSTRTSSREYDSILGSDIVGTLNTSDAKHILNQYVNENKVVVEPFVKSSDVGDIRTTTAIVGSLLGRIPGTNHEGVRDGQLVLETAETLLVDGTRVGDVRVYDPPVQTLSARMGTGGNNVPVIGFSHTQGLSAQPSESAFPTLRTEGAGMAVALDAAEHQPMAVRRLTPIECERLMGWPDDWTAGQSDSHRYRQCGNGVASPVAEWIGKLLVSVAGTGKLV